MASLKELIAQREALDRQIESASKQVRHEGIAKVRAMMAEYGLTLADLSVRAAPKVRVAAGKKVAAKYRDKSTGETWSGRGLQPKWLKAAIAAGRKIGDFAV